MPAMSGFPETVQVAAIAADMEGGRGRMGKNCSGKSLYYGFEFRGIVNVV